MQLFNSLKKYLDGGVNFQPTNAEVISLASDAVLTDAGAKPGSDPICALVYVGTGGDLKVDMVGLGTAIVLKNIPDGTILPFKVKKVYSTANGTTASNLVWMY